MDAVHELGALENFHPHASSVLLKKYGGDADIQRQLAIVTDYLLEERFLFPFIRTDRELANGFARGLTPKGFRRLQELKHPARTWLKANRFGVAVASFAAFSTLIGATSLLVSMFQ